MINTARKQIVVVGGGMAGTAAAHSLLKRGYDVTIVEKSNRLGGRMRSELVDGAAVEMGAGFITKIYTNVRAFLADARLDGNLYRQHTASGILKDGAVRMATPGLLLDNKTLSWSAKLRAVALLAKILGSWRHIDIHVPGRAEKYDAQSVAQMFHGRAGKEFLEYVLQPVLNGYFYWTPERTSEAMMLIIGKAVLVRGGTLKLSGGLQQIPEKASEGCKVLIEHAVKCVERMPSGKYQITVEHDGQTQFIQADGVVCATTASVVPKIISGLSEQQIAFFSSINYSSTVVVARTYKKEQLLSDMGIAFPREEKSKLAAVTASPELAGHKLVLGTVKAYASDADGKELCNKSDEEIARVLTDAMKPIRQLVLHKDAVPISTHIQRWPEAIPMFEPGHVKKLKSFASGAIENPTQALVFAGDYIGGPYIEGAFTSGLQAAKRLDKQLSGR